MRELRLGGTYLLIRGLKGRYHLLFGDFNHCRPNIFVIGPCETILFIDNDKIDTGLWMDSGLSLLSSYVKINNWWLYSVLNYKCSGLFPEETLFEC